MIPPVISRDRLRRTVRAHRPGPASDQMLIFGDRHLRPILAEYEAHDTRRRSCQLRPSQPNAPIAGPSQEPIGRRPVLGGLSMNTSGLGRSLGQRQSPNPVTPQGRDQVEQTKSHEPRSWRNQLIRPNRRSQYRPRVLKRYTARNSPSNPASTPPPPPGSTSAARTPSPADG
jgi:hypothetical protein